MGLYDVNSPELKPRCGAQRTVLSWSREVLWTELECAEVKPRNGVKWNDVGWPEAEI